MPPLTQTYDRWHTVEVQPRRRLATKLAKADLYGPWGRDKRSIQLKQVLSEWKLSTPRSTWRSHAFSALSALLAYPDDADEWSPRRPDAKTYSLAKEVISNIVDLSDLPETRAWSTPEGGVRFGWRKGLREFDLELMVDGSIEFLQRESGKLSVGGQLRRDHYQKRVNGLLRWVSK